jgi:putative ABC transport system permease protein
MLRNYLAAALRNLLRNRAVTFINIAGLAIGFAAALLVALYVRYEHRYEDFIPGHERIYRLSARLKPGIWEDFDVAFLPAARWLELDFPEIASAVRIKEEWLSLTAGEIEFKEQTYTADPDFFRMFAIPAIAGDLSRALDVPDSVAISRAVARKYFGNAPALGRIFEVEKSAPDRRRVLRVTAVFEDLPGNSHFNFRIVMSGRGHS